MGSSNGVCLSQKATQQKRGKFVTLPKHQAATYYNILRESREQSVPGCGPRQIRPAPGNTTQPQLRLDASRCLQEVKINSRQPPLSYNLHRRSSPVRYDDPCSAFLPENRKTGEVMALQPHSRGACGGWGGGKAGEAARQGGAT